MPGPKRERRARTDEWASIKQWTLWPEQELYEQIRPLVLFHQTAGEQGGARETQNSLPPEMRQLIVDLHAQHPGMSWREIVEMCYIRHGRRPAHHSVKHIATAGPPPSLQVRRYQPWHLIADPAERKLAVIRLHSEGWSITSIAEYMKPRGQPCMRPSGAGLGKEWQA
jgi:putative transposase